MDDVVIAGGGPAGAMAAIILARAGLTVRVFDRACFPRPKLCGDTLNPGGCRTIAAHLPLTTLVEQARPIGGMLLTGPDGVRVRGRYRHGVSGYAIERRALDEWLLARAVAAGARVEQDTSVDEAIVAADRVTGVRVRCHRNHRNGGHRNHRSHESHESHENTGRLLDHPARLVIAADGRHSRLAFSLGLARHPPQPRRWAIGAYFEHVGQLSDAGEMHVRRGHYIGVAPLPGGIANACLVVPHATGDPTWGDAAAKLMSMLAADPELGPRFAPARMTGTPSVLGPMAVDVPVPGTPGLLLAGDAAGFIDPITGDGLTFALRGSVLAANVAMDVLAGRLALDRSVTRLAGDRRRAFAAKWRFNRSLRRLVASPQAVTGAAMVARVLPRVFESVIRYAGDVGGASAFAEATADKKAPPLHG
jgi:flavin-dependent dehydrogenase